MNEANKIKATIILSSIFIFLISFATGKSIDDNLFRWISGVSSAVVLVWTVYEKWFWRLSLFGRLSELTGTPILYGTRKGILTYESDVSGKKGNVPIYLAINQT
ncbi:hypothetical protein KKA49_02020 [Patescibacteria group bacterium]|nr:hypothetical protein [Patescibacteria group bacterium]MBU1457750.1 hypothetical protein [Patescibacteria group bacterium]